MLLLLSTSSRETIIRRKELAPWSTNKTSSEQPKTANSAPQKKANDKNKTISTSSNTTAIQTTSRKIKRNTNTSLIKKITMIMKFKTVTLSKTTRNKTSKMAKETTTIVIARKTMLARSAGTLPRKMNTPLIEPIKLDSLSITLSFACLVRMCAQFRDDSSCSIRTGGSSRKKTSLSRSQLL